MDISALLSEVESLLEMDDQADRSVVLDKIRESITNLGGDIQDYENKVNDLEADVEKYKERNKALFNRVDGRPAGQDEQSNSSSNKESLEKSISSGTFFG